MNSISQSASLKFDNVKVENAQMNIKKQSYSQLDNDKPLFKGTFGVKPHSIFINQINWVKSSPEKDKEYLILQGTFEDSCEEWKDTIKFDNSKFKSRLLQSSQKIS